MRDDQLLEHLIGGLFAGVEWIVFGLPIANLGFTRIE